MAEKLVIHDISMPLTEGMTTYPGDVPYHRQLQHSMADGGSANVSWVEMSAHTGTHIDAPRHYYQDGCSTDAIPLEQLYGPAEVVDCRGVEAVTAEVLRARLAPETKRLLLKTDNSQRLHDDPRRPFNRTFVYLDADAAAFIVERGMLLVAIDYLSIDKSELADKSSHHTLLSNGITIVEGVDLAAVEAGMYFLACGPLRMIDSDGAPCRTVLIDNLF